MDTIQQIHSVNQDAIRDMEAFETDPKAWIERQQGFGQNTWLLAYADDGLIWGKLKGGKLLLARDVYENSCPELALDTLQHLYLFGAKAEVHTWKEEGVFRGCRIEDGPDSPAETVDMNLALWGTKIRQASSPEFTWMEDGSQGLRHAAPVAVTPSKLNDNEQKRPLRLKVRQYLGYDEDGQVFVAAVRLVDVHEE